ncbi:tetratricopeptide repeat protein [Flagellimonas meishanensis]|uniref:hybrid sensor histidine kinase/response regulator transcription factor n=1 Tax=Flagellimonas meishanensis TaxID=2873264 RepID=UPI001CA68812|nr:tetratricopeptide repeat protein [[Muricauda] meishanensis]
MEQRLGVERADSSKVKTLLSLANEYRYVNQKKAEKNVLAALQIAKRIKDKKVEVSGLIARADLFADRSSYDSAVTVFSKALSIAEHIEFNDGKSAALIGLGNTHTRKGDLDKGEEYLQLNIAFATETKDFEGVASSYNNLGNIYNERGEYKKAMEAYTEAAKMNSAIGHEKNTAINFANIGMINQKLEDSEKAILYYQESDSIFKKLDFLPGRAFVQNGMGIVYRNIQKPDKALQNYLQALESYAKMGRKREMSQTYQNIGNIFSDKKQSGEAIENYRRSLSIATEINDSINMAMASQALGQEFLYSKKLDSAAGYSIEAIEIARAIGAKLTVMDGYKTLSEVNFAIGDYKKAYDFRIKYEAEKDSLYTIEKRDLAEDIEAKYQNEQKTREIALLASEKEVQALQLGKRKNERNAIIIFALFILLLAILLYNLYRIKQRSNKELQELDRLKSNFFANISHEFRTPLTLIQGLIQHLEQNPDQKLEKEDIKMIRRNTNRLLGLVNQLLDLSKIDEGKLKLKPSEGDVFKCIRTAAASFNSYAVQHQMDYRIKVPDTALWASFDRDKMEKVIYNLLSNAFKFNDEAGKVIIEVSHGNDELMVQVSDNGEGIAPEKLPFIFDRFYQVDGGITKEREGSGIGLSLSRDLVELMDGTITVSSEVGQGTFFTVQVPMQKIRTGQRSELATMQNQSAMDKGTFDFPKTDDRSAPKILVIEDNEDMRQYIGKQLLEHYRVMEARNGEQGLKLAISGMPELIITDLMMPKIDGMELCKQLKSNIETSHIPVIMLTAMAGEKNKIEGLETGADDYLTKPFSAKELLARVRNLMAQRQRLRHYYSDNQASLEPAKLATTTLDRRFLNQLLELMEKEYADPNFGAPQMQMALAMSKTQLHRKIRALTNESPGELLRNFRLKKAANLLSQKADTVTQIAYQVGFNNLSYFAKCFKALYGVSPSSY